MTELLHAKIKRSIWRARRSFTYGNRAETGALQAGESALQYEVAIGFETWAGGMWRSSTVISVQCGHGGGPSRRIRARSQLGSSGRGWNRG